MTLAVNIAQGGSNNVTFRNRIINGAMVIDQRNAGASVNTTVSANQTYTLDRWFYLVSATSKFTVQQNAGSVTPPAGFTNYLGCTSSSAYSVGATDYLCVGQRIEGFNFADLNWGTANARTITISFWVYSSLTGTFGGFLRNSANNRFYPFSYTISSANTWTQINVTIAGDTTGTWVGATNGIGLDVNFNLALGSAYSGTANAWTASTILGPTGATSVVGTNGATLYITGVQLEAGSTASPFEYRQYGTELFLCQRYFTYFTPAQYTYFYDIANTVYRRSSFALPVQMRVTPTVYATSGVTGNSAGPTVSAVSVNNFEVSANGASSGTLVYWDTPAYVTLGAEL